MSGKYDNLKKLPKEPARRVMSASGMKFQTKLDAPVSAGIPEVLAELEAKEAWVDMAILLAAALPGREAVWWACLAARDVLGDAPPTPCLKTAEAWVFDPKDDHREKLFNLLQTVGSEDPAADCASAALQAPGNLGPGEMAEIAAPPAAVPGAVLSMNIEAIKGRKDPMGHFRHLIDRALDIAAGGNGKLEPAGAPKEEAS